MHIITRKRLNDFAQGHPAAKVPLDAWFKIMNRARFQNLMEIRVVFPATDDVQGLCVFNIGGNKYRLVTKHDLRQQDLPELGSQGVVSEILSGKRELNLRHIEALSLRFKVPPEVFLPRS